MNWPLSACGWFQGFFIMAYKIQQTPSKTIIRIEAKCENCRHFSSKTKSYGRCNKVKPVWEVKEHYADRPCRMYADAHYVGNNFGCKYFNSNVDPIIKKVRKKFPIGTIKTDWKGITLSLDKDQLSEVVGMLNF